MSAPLTSPLGGDDLAKALRDAYGRGYAHCGRQAGEEPQGLNAYNDERDAWIAQYIARLPAAEPRCGPEDLRHEATFLLARLRDFESELTDEQAGDWYGHVTPSMERLQALASAPSPEAGSGEDLAGQVRNFLAAARSDGKDQGRRIAEELGARDPRQYGLGYNKGYLSALCDIERVICLTETIEMDNSGNQKTVARKYSDYKDRYLILSEGQRQTSTAQAGADSAAILSGSGADAAPLADAPSRLSELERLSVAAGRFEQEWRLGRGRRRIKCGVDDIADCEPEIAAYLVALVRDHRSGKLVASTGSEEETKGEPLKLSRDEVIRDCVERAKDFWSIVDGAAPVDPQMTVEADQIENLIAIWSMRPAPGCEAGQAWEAGARQGWKWALAALRTLQAGGEVRHDQ